MLSLIHIDVYKRQVRKRIGSAAYNNLSLPIVDFIQQKPVFHLKGRISQNDLSFQFKENNSDGFVHPGNKQHVFWIIAVFIADFRSETVLSLIHI